LLKIPSLNAQSDKNKNKRDLEWKVLMQLTRTDSTNTKGHVFKHMS